MLNTCVYRVCMLSGLTVFIKIFDNLVDFYYICTIVNVKI